METNKEIKQSLYIYTPYGDWRLMPHAHYIHLSYTLMKSVKCMVCTFFPNGVALSTQALGVRNLMAICEYLQVKCP